MSGPTPSGSPPPEVPEEFAAAYRAAYEQALAAQSRREEQRGPLPVGAHRPPRPETRPEPEPDDRNPTWFERIRDSGWFVPLLLGLLALLLILGAYAVGRRFARDVAADEPGAQPSVALGQDGGQGTAGARQPVTNQKPAAGAWTGTVQRLGDVRARAGCTDKAGVDASGAKVSYAAANLTDGVADTTWRCAGPAIGEKITLDLGRDVPIGQVGLIPGYAKTDPKSRADRYAENNRVTRVRWTIGDRVVVQKLSGKPDDRSLQLVRVPRTSTRTVGLEILAVAKGPRNTTAISEVQLGRAE